jgi:hypothetical protein
VTDQDGGADRLGERYEQLRRIALGGSGQADGFLLGLAVLTSRGTAAWMRACGGTRPSPVAPPGATPAVIPAPRSSRDAFTSEVVAVLAQMALAQI